MHQERFENQHIPISSPHTVLSSLGLCSAFSSPVYVALSHTFTTLMRVTQFGGHELIPNLVRDMAEPKKADKVMHISYAISMIVYIVVAVVGYLMYGTNVSDEVRHSHSG